MTEKRTRPVTSGARFKEVGETWTPSYGLRRRREASYRLAPLDCGHRDPLDCDEVRIFSTSSIEAAEAAKAHLQLAGVA